MLPNKEKNVCPVLPLTQGRWGEVTLTVFPHVLERRDEMLITLQQTEHHKKMQVHSLFLPPLASLALLPKLC